MFRSTYLPFIRTRKISLGWIDFLFFLYFLTLHADQLSFTLKGVTLRLNNLLALSLFACFLLNSKFSFFSFDKKMVKGVLALFVSLGLSLFFSAFSAKCVVFLGWFGFTILNYFLLPYLIILHFDERKVLRLYFLSFVCVGMYGALQLVLSFIGIYDPFANQIFGKGFLRPNAFCYEPSYFALYLTPFICTVNLFYLLGKNRDFILFEKLEKKHVFAINLLYLSSTSTAAFFAYFIFLFIVGFYPSIKEKYPFLKRIVVKMGIGCIAFAFILTLLFPSFASLFFMKFFKKNFRSHHSFAERWEKIVVAWDTFLDHPLLGVGYGAYPSHLFEGWRKGKIDFFILNKVTKLENPLKTFEPSNVMTEILASLGIVGFIAFAIFFKAYTQAAQKALHNEEMDQETKDLILSFFISTLVMLIVLQFNQGVLRTYVWVHLGITFAFFTKTLPSNKNDLIAFKNVDYLKNSCQVELFRRGD